MKLHNETHSMGGFHPAWLYFPKVCFNSRSLSLGVRCARWRWHGVWISEGVLPPPEALAAARAFIFGSHCDDRSYPVMTEGTGERRVSIFLGSRALFLGATSLLFSALASRRYLLCYDEVSLLCPQSRLPFNYLCCFFVQGLSPSWRS